MRHRGEVKETITETHRYIYTGGKLLRETISDGTTTKTLDFNYDNVGMPYSLIYNNGTTTAKKSGKEKASDKLSWVDVSQVDFSKTAQQNAARLLDEKWGKGNWSKGPGSDFSKTVKWIQRSLFAYMVQKGIRQTLEER